MAILPIVAGFINESSMLEVAPSQVNKQLAGSITPVNECTFMVPLASKKNVKEVSKLGTFKVLIKDGPCSLKIAPW